MRALPELNFNKNLLNRIALCYDLYHGTIVYMLMYVLVLFAFLIALCYELYHVTIDFMLNDVLVLFAFLCSYLDIKEMTLEFFGSAKH